MKFTNADYRCIGHVCILDSYDKNIQPIQIESNYVYVNFKSIKILKVDDEEFTITLSLYLELIWTDRRVNVDSHFEDILFKNNTFTPINSAIIDKIWVPAPYIFDLKSIKTKARMLYLVDQKYITYNRDLEISLYCYMVFDNYPIDSHVCYFKMNSFNHFEDKFIYKTTMITLANSNEDIKMDGSTMSNGKYLHQFNVLDYEVELNKLTEDQSILEKADEVGEISKRPIAGFKIILHRKYRKYIIYYYVPSGLIAGISCVSI